MMAIRLVLFFLSSFGWWEVLRQRYTVHRVFLPGITVAMQTCLLLLGGLLNLLRETALLLWVGGIACALYYLWQAKGKNIREYFHVESLFFLLGVILLLIYVQGKVFTHFDNFSHWAVAVRSLLKEHHLPNFESRNITYREYPMGSTVYIYYFSLLVGDSEPMQMFAQALMMLYCMLPLMKDCDRHPIPALMLMLLLGNFFLAYNVQATELLVDTLLPLAGMFAVVLICSCRDYPDKVILPVTASLIWVIQIKSSGLFFAGMAGILLIIFAKKNRKIPYALGILAMAAGSFLFWKRHCAYVYPADDLSKHALSLSQWQTVVKGKSVEDIKHIILQLWKFLLGWREVWLTLFLLICAGVCVFLFSKENVRRYGRGMTVIVLMFLAWQVGLLFVYIFSMPLVEAFYLSSIDRYEKTIILAIVYLMGAILFPIFLSKEKKAVSAFCAALLMGLSSMGLLGLSGERLCFSSWQPYQINCFDGLEARSWMEGLKEEYQLPDQGDYAVLIEGWDSGYFDYLGNYIFPEAADMFPMEAERIEDLERLNQTYVLIHDRENPVIQEWVHQHYPEQEGCEVIVRGDASGMRIRWQQE